MKDDSHHEFLRYKELLKQNKYVEAKKIIEELHNVEPSDLVITFELAKLYLREPSTESKGVMLLNSLLSTKNKYAAYLELGKYYSEHDNLEKAMSCFKSMISGNEKDVNYAILEIGKLYLKLGNTKSAVDCFVKLIHTNAVNKNYALFELGKIKASEEDFEEARKIFKFLLNGTSKDKSYALLELGKVEIKDRNFISAKKYLEELIKLNDFNRDYAILEMGRLFSTFEKYDQARVMFNKILTTKSANYAILELGKMEAKIGNLESARNNFNKLLLGNEKDKAYATLELGMLDILNDDVDAARSKFKSLLKSSNWHNALFELAILESIEGNTNLAVGYLQKLIDNNAPNKKMALEELEKIKGYKVKKVDVKK